MGTLLVVEPGAVAYVKLRALDGPLPVAGGEEAGLGYFLLEVGEVTEDAAAEWEAGVRITAAAQYRPARHPGRAMGARGVDALATPRARVLSGRRPGLPEPPRPELGAYRSR